MDLKYYTKFHILLVCSLKSHYEKGVKHLRGRAQWSLKACPKRIWDPSFFIISVLFFPHFLAIKCTVLCYQALPPWYADFPQTPNNSQLIMDQNLQNYSYTNFFHFLSSISNILYPQQKSDWLIDVYSWVWRGMQFLNDGAIWMRVQMCI